jgi:WD40 repeat protein
VFSPDGALLANDGGGFTVQVAELATGTIRGRLEFYEGLTRFVDPSEVPLPYPPNHILNVVTFAFSPDSKRLAIGTGGWRHPPGTNLSDLALYEIPQWECDRRLTPLLGDVTVWTADAPRVFKTLSGFNRIMSSVQFSPRGDTLLAVGHRGRPKSRDNYDRVLNLWDPATGQVKAALNHEHDIRCASFSPDGKLLAVGGGEQGSGRDELGKLTIWTLATR